MKKILLWTFSFSTCLFVENALSENFFMPDCSKIMFSTGVIQVGNCKDLEVYVARTDEQNICGMLKFNDKTFLKHGMLFIGRDKDLRKRYFHTQGMNMTIRIMGLKEVGPNKFEVTNNDAKFSPPGLSSIEIIGTHVFEITERMYKNNLNKCIYTLKK